MTTTNITNTIVPFTQVIYAEITPNPFAMKFVINYYEFKFRLCQKDLKKKENIHKWYNYRTIYKAH